MLQENTEEIFSHYLQEITVCKLPRISVSKVLKDAYQMRKSVLYVAIISMCVCMACICVYVCSNRMVNQYLSISLRALQIKLRD